MTRALITGGGRGIGAATAARLAGDGCEVVRADVGGDCDVILDVTDRAAVQRAVRETGPVDVLVNCAGIVGPNVALVDTPADAWRKVFEVNVLGTVSTMQACVPGMVERGWGRVVNLASMAGKELATTGVLVNAVAPAVIATPMNDDTAPDVLAHITGLIPMKRAGTAEEVAELIAWLASDRVSFSTGAVYDISGGRATY